MARKGFLWCMLCILLFSACGTEKNRTKETAQLTVLTSFYPIYLLAQEVVRGAEGIRLENMAQPQTGCLHEYELSVSDMKRLEQADVFLINGGGMEGFLEEALERYPDLVVVDTSEGISLLEEEHHHHADEEAHTDEEEEGNSHIWLSPERAAKQAERIAEALGELDAAEQELFDRNAKAFATAANGLVQEAAQVGIVQDTAAAVFHEGFAYITELFCMEAVCGIFVDEYQMPSAKEMANAAEEAKRHGIRFFLAAADTGRIYAQTLAKETGERVIILDPLTTAMEGNPSYIERMKKNIEAMAQHWRETAR